MEPTNQILRSRQRILTSTVLMAAILWIVSIGACLAAMSSYRWTPGQSGTVPEKWIPNSLIQPDGQRSTLVMFAHPRCPCTQASLAEFQNLTAQSRTPVQAVIVFYCPDDRGPEWRNTSNWTTARGLNGVSVIEDSNGQLAALFAAECSGLTCLYSPEGTLQYAGGITSGRGHQGESTGLAALQKFLVPGPPERTTPVQCSVYGCSLNSNIQFPSENRAP